MKPLDIILIILTILAVGTGAYIGLLYDIYWPIILGVAGIAFGSLSLLVYSRRLMYIAAASPHGAFLSASLAIPITVALGGSIDVWMILLSILVIYLAGYLAYKGLDPDEATSIYVGISATGGVLAAYLVLTRYPYSSQVIASVIGDPLLTSKGDAILATIVSIGFLLLALSGLREVLYIGADPEDARLSGINVWLYDLFLYTSIAIIAAVMVRIVGFVLEHVMILLPGLIAHYSTRGAYRAFVTSVVISFTMSIFGLYLAILLDQSPSAMTGALLVLVFLAVFIWGKRHG